MKLIMFTQVIDQNATVQGFAHEWAKSLAERLDTLYVIANRLGEHELPQNVRVFSLGAEEGASRTRKLYRLWKITAKVVRKDKLDGAFVHQIEQYGLATYPFLKVCGVPVIQFKAHKGVPWTLKLAGNLFDHFVTSTRGGLDLETPDLTVIGQAIDTNLFSPAQNSRSNETLQVTSVGRISPVKDYETVLEGFSGVDPSKLDADVKLKIVGGPARPGDGQYLRSLKDRVRNLGFEGTVEFTGALANDEIPEHLRETDLFINASRTGSLDKSGLEAMACECLLLTSNPAYAEILPEDLAETMTYPTGETERLTRKIEMLLSLAPEKRRRLGAKLREVVVRDHGLDRFMDNLVAVFESKQE